MSHFRTEEPGSSRASDSAAGMSMSTIITAAPAAARTRQVASPMPLAPPVTTARRPSKRKGVFMCWILEYREGSGLLNRLWVVHDILADPLRVFLGEAKRLMLHG